VGFAGTNSIEPISLSAAEPAVLSDGTWSTSERDGYVFLSVQDREEEGVLRDLYCWSTTGCMYPDLLQANHWSCTWGTARFTSQLFVARTNEAQTEKIHILNNKFVRRAIAGAVQETTEITSVEQLEEMLRTHFNLDLGACDPETLEAVQTGNGVKRYL
jgi:arylamine N-acetyltransferase